MIFFSYNQSSLMISALNRSIYGANIHRKAALVIERRLASIGRRLKRIFKAALKC